MIIGLLQGGITRFETDGSAWLNVSGWMVAAGREIPVELICIHEGAAVGQVCPAQDKNGAFALPPGEFDLRLPLGALRHAPTPQNTILVCRLTGAALPLVVGDEMRNVRGEVRARLDVLSHIGTPHRQYPPPQGAIFGGAWMEGFGAVVGWAVRPSGDDHPATVALEINGATAAATLTADLSYRPSEGEGAAPVGFRFELNPDRIAFGDNRIRIIDPATGLAICEDVTFRGDDRIRGHVELVQVDGVVSRLKGWARDMAHPTKSAKFDVFIRGRPAANGVARGARPDVRDALGGTISAGFDIEVIGTIERLEDLSISLSGTSHPILTSPSTAFVGTGPGADFDGGYRPAEARTLGSPIEGSVDAVDDARLSGWALHVDDPDRPVQLALFLNGAPYSLVRTRGYRADVKATKGGLGFCGFTFELDPQLNLTRPVVYTLRAASGAPQAIGNGDGIIPPRFESALPAPRLKNAALPIEPSPAYARPLVSLIVLNRDGSHFLERFFRTFLDTSTGSPVEIIIVDHGSNDDSRRVVESFRGEMPDSMSLVYLQRDPARTFSESNNFAARTSRGDVLLFINNDIEFETDIVGPIADALASDRVAAVGVRLVDMASAPEWRFTSPIQHLGVYFDFHSSSPPFRPYELRFPNNLQQLDRALAVPAVTGAVLACRRGDFERVGGFDEGFYYGFEDVDLCLRLAASPGREVVCLNGTFARHARGATRQKSSAAQGKLIAENKRHFLRRWGHHLLRRARRDLFTGCSPLSAKPPVIALAVTDADVGTSAGDYFTALELGEALRSELGAQIVFLGRREWYKLIDVDVVIALLDDFNPKKIESAGSTLTVVAWARNWFDRWCERGHLRDFHHVWASSETAAALMNELSGRRVDVLRLATNPARFERGEADPKYVSDACFPGSYFEQERDISRQIEYLVDEAKVVVVGHNWDSVPGTAALSVGPVAYSSMSSVYASTRIVLDDANSATAPFGSVNSRVFDGLAAGCLVLTNGVLGARETFGDRLPTFSSGEELKSLVSHYLRDEAARRAKIDELRAEVLARHTYAARASTIRALLAAEDGLRFAIKIGAPRSDEQRKWGDYHFALALAREIEKRGHKVRIDALDSWNGPLSRSDDCVICLRGLSEYTPKPEQLNLLWMISHPEAVSAAELETFDHIFVASQPYAQALASFVTTPVSVLLQCTDPERFRPDLKNDLLPEHDLLFVGNSRGIRRKIIFDAIDVGLRPAVYGDGWDGLLPDGMLRGTHVPNEALGQLYANASIVLNDHWADMQKHGFVSNRIFDAAACATRVVSDDVSGLADIFGDSVVQRAADASLIETVERSRRIPQDGLLALADIVRRDHSFAARAGTIVDKVTELMAQPDRLSRA